MTDHRARPPEVDAGRRRRGRRATPVGESPAPRRRPPAAAGDVRRSSAAFARTAGGHRRDRRQGAPRPDARPAGVRHPDRLPAPARRLRLDGRADHGADVLDAASAAAAAFASAAIGQGIFAALLMLETLLVVFLAPDGDGRRDQPRAREADPRAARRDADHVAGDRPRQAPQRAHLRLPPDRRLDPADGRRLRLRRRRARRRRARLPRPGRDGARARGVRAVLLEPREADPGGDGHHDLRRPRRSASARSSSSSSGRRCATAGRAVRGVGPIRAAPPEALVYLNPFLAQADVALRTALCETDSSLRYCCQFRSTFVPTRTASSSSTATRAAVAGRDAGRPGTAHRRRRTPASSVGAVASPSDVAARRRRPFGVGRDAIWPKTRRRLARPVGRLPRPLRPVRLADPSLAPAPRRRRTPEDAA